MSNDTKWIIGTVVVLVGLLSAQIAGVNARVDDLSGDLNARIETRRAAQRDSSTLRQPSCRSLWDTGRLPAMSSS